MTPLLDTALAYREAGLSVIPLNRSDKRPDIGLLPRDENDKPTWKPFQSLIADKQIITRWFKTEANIGIVCGEVSGGLLVMDFDLRADDIYRDWCHRVGEIAKLLPTVRTGKGFHVYVRCDKQNGTALAMSAINEKLIETRGEGNYIIAPPSIHPVTKQPYKAIRGDLLGIPHLDSEQLENLMAAARSFDERVRRQTKTSLLIGTPVPGARLLEKALARAAPGNRNETGFWLACQLRDAGLNQAAAHEVMVRFQKSVPQGDDPYTLAEAVASLKQAFGVTPRDSVAKTNGVTSAVNPRHFEAPVPSVLKPLLSQEIFSLKFLLKQELPQPRWAVPNLLPEGLILLAGKPKLGKSWLALALAIAIASGGRALGQYQVTTGDVLYLALEDNPRRIQKRARKLLGEGPIPDRLEFATRWKRLDSDGVPDLDLWLNAHSDARLIVIDTFARVRPRPQRIGNLYDEDYNALEGVKALADRYGVTIFVVHHLRKMSADDPLDAISGTTGLTGAIDGALILNRTRGNADANLLVVGRDIEEDLELALRFDSMTAQWIAVGNARDFKMSNERLVIRDAIANAKRPLSPSEVASVTGQSTDNVKSLMSKMARAGELKALGRGKYAVPTL